MLISESWVGMATIHQTRGLLLEEVLLHLLRRSGYKTVEKAGVDPTLKDGRSGLEVRGRGERHQIDAIADFSIAQPFSYPQRLLVEAKFMGSKVGLPIIRNAVGVLKDVGEHFVPVGNSSSAKHRYSYRYAVFSASGYSPPAERYAFAQDIYLIPLDGSSFLSPVLDAIEDITAADFGDSQEVDVDLKKLRSSFRESLKGNGDDLNIDGLQENAKNKLNDIVAGTRRIDGALLAMMGNRFPVFLVPQSAEILQSLELEIRVRIFWDDKGWYLSRANGPREERLFSFDVPPDLFKLYDKQGVLTPLQAVDLKERFMSDMQAIHVDNGRVRVHRFVLDQEWLERVRNGIRITRPSYGQKRKGDG